jgi:hypothetical protein
LDADGASLFLVDGPRGGRQTLVSKVKIFWFTNLSRIKDTLLKDLCKFMILFRWILIKNMNFFRKSLEKRNQDTYFVLDIFSPKIVPFLR